MAVGLAKAFGLALLLRKGLDHANARNGVGQHIGHFAPDTVNLLKASAQPVAHKVDHPADKRQRHQGDERQVGVHREKNDGGHDDHHHVAGKVGQVQGQIHRNAVALTAHAREQIARALAAKVFERQAQQVLVGGGAQVGSNALRCQRQYISLGPAQDPGQQARTQQARQIPGHGGQRDLLAVLVGDQHLVYQRNSQVGRHLAGGGPQQHEHKTQQQLATVGLRKAPKAKKCPGRRWRVDHFGTHRAFFLVRVEGRFAAWAHRLRGWRHRLAAD